MKSSKSPIIDIKNGNNEIFERTESLMRYYAQIKNYGVLSFDEEQRLFNIIKNGDEKEKEKAIEKIVKCNMKFVVSVARKFGTNENLLDLINEGNIALLEAIETFNPDKQYKFITWAVWYIRRAINTYYMTQDATVRKPNPYHTYHVISQVTNRFIQNEERNPTLEELADNILKEYGVKVNDVNDLIQIRMSSIDERPDEDETESYEMKLFNDVSASTNDYGFTENKDFNSRLTKNLLNALNDKEKEVIKLSFGIGCDRDYGLQEVAEIIGMTSERVRQLKAEAIKKMEKYYQSALKLT